MKEIAFVKSQGAGNDFVIIDEIKGENHLGADNLRLICDRHYGIGADGVVIVRPSVTADFKMIFYNPDGSQAEICGNGIRCLARYLYDHKRTERQKMSIETMAGIRAITLEVGYGEVRSITVDMGKANFLSKMVPIAVESNEHIDQPIAVEEREFAATCVSMGNPHCVIFVDDLENFEAGRYGKLLEMAPIFPERANIGFAKVRKRSEIDLVVWERGAGLTLACGTGACAAAVAGGRIGILDRGVKVNLPGGSLDVQWAESGSVYLSGPTEEVFTGIIGLE